MTNTVSNELEKRIQGVKSLIVNTPTLEIHLRHHGEDRVLYAKVKPLN